ncbi:MAG: N-6 DNA methylase [Weissella confusa]
MSRNMTEDQVREFAANLLTLYETHDGATSGAGQLTTFNNLGFKGILDKPDGWYLPKNSQDTALLLETKSTKVSLAGKAVDELLKNINIISTKYKKVVGVLFNGNDIRVFKNTNEIQTSPRLENLTYYLRLFEPQAIDTQHIFDLTSKINNLLHFTFGIKDLYHRMIFTASTLVAKRYGALLVDGMDYPAFQNSVASTLNKALIKDKKQNQKLELLLDVFSEIKMNLNINTEDEKEQEAMIAIIADFIKWVGEISDAVDSDIWRGEDVMGIFFNEFNRYKAKSENGQIFTPEHITDFMYKIAGVGMNDLVLDAAAGSGGFLVKAMANMIAEAGGVRTNKAAEIKKSQLFGIEFDRQIFALAAANMLIHKDGKTNLEQLDSRNPEAGNWIKSKGITKVLMNPPYEHKYGPIKIMENVLDNVTVGTTAAFLLPDKKLEKEPDGRKLLNNHSLKKIIKMPKNLFLGIGIQTSIFVFEAGKPHGKAEIFTAYLEDDGLETVKNKGRQDVNHTWPKIEAEWVNIVMKQSGHPSIKWIAPTESLSYHEDIPEFALSTSDIDRTVLNRLLFEKNMSLKELQADITENVLFSKSMNPTSQEIFEASKLVETQKIDISTWKTVQLSELFEIGGSTTTPKNDLNLDLGGNYNYVTTSSLNNGVAGNTQLFTEFGNVLTVDSATVGTSFYQDINFAASDHVEILNAKFYLNKVRALFFSSILNVNAVRLQYGFDEKRSQKALGKETITIPYKGDYPDFNLIESLVRASPYYDYLQPGVTLTPIN